MYQNIISKIGAAKLRSEKRKLKRKSLIRQKAPIKSATPSILRLDGLWGLAIKLRDKKVSPLCRICAIRYADTAYHIVPKQRGNAIRWLLENGTFSCTPCNFGEQMNRSLYRDKHIVIFGKDRVEAIELIARQANGQQPDKWAVEANLRAFIENLQRGS